MKKSLLIRCAIGLVLGITLMFVVPSLLSGMPVGAAPLYTERFLSRVWSPAAAAMLTLLVIALYGAVCMGGTIFYEFENWSLAKATAAHYLSISLGYVVVDLLLCWGMPLKLLLILEGIMTVGFFLIWLIMYLRYKAEVRELNELNRKKNGK